MRASQGMFVRRIHKEAPRASCPAPHVLAAERGYSLRRFAYVGSTSAACLIISTILVLRGYDSVLAQTLVKGLMDLLQVQTWLYLGAGVLDRSGVLAKIGDGFASRRGPPPGVA